jgi:hypothetical protein
MILGATRDAARFFLELGTVTVVLAVGARLAGRTDRRPGPRGEKHLKSNAVVAGCARLLTC